MVEIEGLGVVKLTRKGVVLVVFLGVFGCI